MALGISAAIANDIIDAFAKNDAFTTLPAAAFWVQLHTGDPGASGTANVAGNSTRKQATFGSAASAGTIANTVALSWTSVSTSETYTRFSVFTASTSGTFLFSGTMTANAVTAGDDFNVAIGALTLTLTVAA